LQREIKHPGTNDRQEAKRSEKIRTNERMSMKGIKYIYIKGNTRNNRRTGKIDGRWEKR